MCYRRDPQGALPPNNPPFSFDPMARTISDSTLEGGLRWLRSWLLSLLVWLV